MGTIDEKIYQKYIVVLSAISRPLFQWVTLLLWYVAGNNIQLVNPLPLVLLGKKDYGNTLVAGTHFFTIPWVWSGGIYIFLMLSSIAHDDVEI